MKTRFFSLNALGNRWHLQSIPIVLALLCGLLPVHAVGADINVCKHFQQVFAGLENRYGNENIDTLGAKRLCFDDCTGDQVAAAKFLGKADTAKAAEVPDAIDEDVVTAYVSEVDLNGDGVPEVRIARRVGTAFCVRDTYLKRTGKGYEVIKTPTLEELSAEAGNCGTGAIFFAKYGGVSYAVETFYGRVAAYAVDRQFNLKPVCDIPQK